MKQMFKIKCPLCGKMAGVTARQHPEVSYLVKGINPKNTTPVILDDDPLIDNTEEFWRYDCNECSGRIYNGTAKKFAEFVNKSWVRISPDEKGDLCEFILTNQLTGEEQKVVIMHIPDSYLEAIRMLMRETEKHD